MPNSGEIIQKSRIRRKDGVRYYTEKQFQERRDLNLIPVMDIPGGVVLITMVEYRRRYGVNNSLGT